MSRKQKLSHPTVPGALQHPPAPLQQERDTRYLFGATVMLVSLLGAGLLFHPQPTTLGIGPEPEQPLVADASVSATPAPAGAPAVEPAAATAIPATATLAATATATSAATAASAPVAGTAVGGGGAAVATAPAKTPATSKPVVGIKPVDTVINRTLNLVKNRAKPRAR